MVQRCSDCGVDCDLRMAVEAPQGELVSLFTSCSVVDDTVYFVTALLRR